MKPETVAANSPIVVNQYWSNRPFEECTDLQKLKGVIFGISVHRNMQDRDSFVERESPYGSEKVRPVGSPFSKALIINLQGSVETAAIMNQIAQETMRNLSESKDGYMEHVGEPGEPREDMKDLHDANQSLLALLVKNTIKV